jgi:hypothetical protein
MSEISVPQIISTALDPTPSSDPLSLQHKFRDEGDSMGHFSCKFERKPKISISVGIQN